MTEPAKVTFVCSAREIHRAKLLGEAMVADDGTVTFVSRGPSLPRDGRGRPRHSNTFAKIDPTTGEDYAVFRMLCPSCPTHVEWRLARAETIARGLAERGVTTFDLSMS
jgi:hypothetical protein